MSSPTTPKLTRADFTSDQEVRWCPGCGDFAILATVQRTMPDLGVPKEKIVFVSGIGCSSRFPYYMNTYGFHSIHGRAPAVATGVKCANPDLQVWVVTGDGDGLSIGTNHLIHAMRRNVDLKILLFNNEIYGLTKGQVSPTSPLGKVTKSSPVGEISRPINPIRVALASEATFVARTLDTDLAHLAEMLKRAAAHKGAVFIEILQNCKVFNDGFFEPLSDRATKEDSTLKLEHGKPMIFGKNKDKGIRLKGLRLEVVSFDPKSPPADLLVHDEHAEQPALAFMLTELHHPEFPAPMGVLRQVQAPTYDSLMTEQLQKAGAAELKDVQALITGKETWTVA